MANVAALLSSLLTLKADINFYTTESIYWNAKYEANMEKLQKQVNLEGKYQDAFDSAIDNTKELKAGGVVVRENNKSEAIADNYAHAKVKQYDEDLSLELAALDIDYDTLKTMYDALLEEKRAQKDSVQQAVSTAAQDTGTTQS